MSSFIDKVSFLSKPYLILIEGVGEQKGREVMPQLFSCSLKAGQLNFVGIKTLFFNTEIKFMGSFFNLRRSFP
ncbi:hypothetical protein ACJD0Z_09275 [Flavobacteriaceae bacterium M23B6Z8]